jgi:hypothetical protein
MYISDAHLREFLLDAGLVNKAAFEKATREAQAGKRSIGEILVANGDIGQDELRRTYAYILGIPFLSLKGTKIPYETLSLIPEPVARRNLLDRNHSQIFCLYVRFTAHAMNAVDCNKCSKPIKLAPIPKKSPGIFCRCPACSVLTWVYRPTQKEDVFKALADLVKERAKVCTSCQQKFYDLHNNGTKQCFCCNPTANTAKSSQVQVNRGEYYVYNSNTDRNGPFTLENLGQEIVAGRVRTIDVIGIPDGRRLPLVKIPELIPYLKEFTNGGNNKLLIIKEKRRYTKEIGISFVVLTFITLSTLTYFDIKKGENGFIGVLARDLDIKTLREIASSHSGPKIDQVSSKVRQNVGIIFQIKDDELGMFGDEQRIGKPVCSDIREGKKTLYYYFLFARATNRERAQLKHIFGNKMIGEKEIAIVRAMIERYKIEEKIHTILSREIKAVRKIVSTYQGSAAQKKMLSELLEYNLNRSK